MTNIEWMWYYDMEASYKMLGLIGKQFPKKKYVDELFFLRFGRQTYKMKRLLKVIYHELPPEVHNEKPPGYIHLKFLVYARINKKLEKYYDID